MELTNILRCPKTGNKLRFYDEDSIVRVENSDVTYPSPILKPLEMGKIG